MQGFLFLFRFDESLCLSELNIFVCLDISDLEMDLSIAVTFLKNNDVILFVSTD